MPGFYRSKTQIIVITSGLAWAELNVKNESIKSFGREIELDIVKMNINRSTLSTLVPKPIKKEAEVQIKTSCSRGRQTLRHDETYQLKL